MATRTVVGCDMMHLFFVFVLFLMFMAMWSLGFCAGQRKK